MGSKISETNGGTPVAPASGDLFAAARGSGNVPIDYDELVDAIIGKIYPVGSLYTSTLSTNPATLLGFGTWEAFGEGRVWVGRDAMDTDFDTAEETGGSKTSAALLAHTHSVTDAGHNHTQDSHNHTQDAHTHTVTDPGHVHAISTGTTDGAVGRVDSSSSAQAATFNTNSATTGITNQNATATNQSATATNQAATTGVTVDSAGSGSSFSILPPYIVVYAWKRAA